MFKSIFFLRIIAEQLSDFQFIYFLFLFMDMQTTNELFL